MNLTTIAEKLNLPADIIERESVKHFLERKLLETKTELFALADKYKVKSIREFDNLIKKGKIHETPETREDFFKIDYLQSQSDILNQLIKTV